MLQNLRPKSRAMRVNPKGPELVLCEWPWSITAMTNTKKMTRWSREDAKRYMDITSVASCIAPKNEPLPVGSIVLHTPLKRCKKTDAPASRERDTRFEGRWTVL